MPRSHRLQTVTDPSRAAGRVGRVGLALLVPFTFALSPVVGLLLASASVTVPPGSSIARIAGAIAIVVVILYLVCRRTRSVQTASNVLGLPLFLVAMYPAAYTIYLRVGSGGEMPFAWAYLLCTAASAVVAARMPAPSARNLHQALAITALAFCAFSAPVFVRTYVQVRQSPAPVSAAVAHLSAPWQLAAGTGRRPDVYHLVLDGMGRPDVLEARYGMPAAPLVGAFHQRGFDLDARRGHANYVQTHLSIPSMLNGTYLDELARLQAGSNDRAPLRALIAQARVPEAFARLGYEVEFIGPGSLTEGAFDRADRCDCPQLWFSEPELGALSLTPLKALLAFGIGHGPIYRRSLAVFAAFERARTGDRPRYVYAHVMLPHPPFVADSEGRFVNPGRAPSGADASLYPGPASEYVRGYRAQATFVVRRTLEAASRLEEAARRDGREIIVIVTGDHGPRLGMDAVNPTAASGQFTLPVLLAIRWPDGVRPGQPPGSLVNVYRVLLDTVFGVDLPILPDRSYVSAFDRPYDLIPVDGLDEPVVTAVD